MTPEQIELVQQSFAALEPHGDELAANFYDRLFTLDPSARSLFSTEPAVQRQKFIDELSAIVWSISNLDTFLDRTMALGARHVEYGTNTAHYEIVREALLGAIAEQQGDQHTPDHGDAWRVAYNLVAETMMMGASQRVDLSLIHI